MTKEEALEHALALQEYCADHTCNNCIFGTNYSDYCCEIASEFGPDGWLLDHLKEET